MTWLPNYLQAARRLSLVGSVPQQIHSLFRDSSPVSLTAYGLATRNRSPNPSRSSGGAADAARQPSFAGVPPPGFSLRSRRGFLPAPGIEEHTSEIAVCVGKVGLQTQCLAQACLGLIETAKISQRIATVAQYLRNVPPDRKRAIIACQCLLMTPAFGQTAADFVPNPGIFGPSSASGRESVFDVLPE
jgi:hypothetical protein